MKFLVKSDDETDKIIEINFEFSKYSKLIRSTEEIDKPIIIPETISEYQITLFKEILEKITDGEELGIDMKKLVKTRILIPLIEYLEMGIDFINLFEEKEIFIVCENETLEINNKSEVLSFFGTEKEASIYNQYLSIKEYLPRHIGSDVYISEKSQYDLTFNHSDKQIILSYSTEKKKLMKLYDDEMSKYVKPIGKKTTPKLSIDKSYAKINHFKEFIGSKIPKLNIYKIIKKDIELYNEEFIDKNPFLCFDIELLK